MKPAIGQMLRFGVGVCLTDFKKHEPRDEEVTDYNGQKNKRLNEKYKNIKYISFHYGPCCNSVQ